MKVMILANPESIHTIRWVTSLCEKGIEIVLFCMQGYDDSYYSGLPNFKSYSLKNKNSFNAADSNLIKLWYITSISKIKKIIRIEKPDILHSHYASSYGLLGALSGFHPFIISVWGSDIYDFPNSSFLAKRLIKYNLSKADMVLSTSHDMARETKKYYQGEILVTPFGVDTVKFIKSERGSNFDANDIVVGTIKSLEKVYGIEYLIEAFCKVVEQNPLRSLKLFIVGSGNCANQYKLLVGKYKIEDKVIFTGHIDHSKIVKSYNQIDIFVVPSLRESFGVSALEASACELPVIVSDTGGLPEVVEDDVTGLLVPPKNAFAIAEAIQKLINEPERIINMGKNGRKMVETKYNWIVSVEKMISVYRNVLNNTESYE